MARRSASLRSCIRALGVCKHIWTFSLRDIWAKLLSPKWAEIFVAQMAGDETSLRLDRGLTLIFDPVPLTYFRPP